MENNKDFSFDTIQNFDQHIAKSIPNYDILFNSIVRLSDYFKNEKKKIFDVGCSTGNLLRYLARTKSFSGNMIGIDVSRNLLPTNTREYDNINFLEYDLTKPYEFNDACIVYAIFVFQFLPKEARLPLLKSIYNGLEEGGALFFCEKVYNEEGNFQDLFTSTYYDYKKESFTEKEIFDKERSLRSLLKPNTDKENIKMLEEAGFKKISCFWRYFNFIGTLAIK
jgi:tRNA (cmo5U34)-methyltransferase